MPRQSVENRLERLDRRVTGIEQLPARMDRLESQIVQLRAEVHDEFSAIRQEIQTGDERSCAACARRFAPEMKRRVASCAKSSRAEM